MTHRSVLVLFFLICGCSDPEPPSQVAGVATDDSPDRPVVKAEVNRFPSLRSWLSPSPAPMGFSELLRSTTWPCLFGRSRHRDGHCCRSCPC